MRLSCTQENLSRGLGIVSRAVATRTTLPITQHVLVSTDNSRVKLSATNLEIAISTWIGAVVEEDGAVTIPARLLNEYISSLSAGTVEFQASSSHGIELKSAHDKANINGSDPSEFPPIPPVDQGVSAQLDSEGLKEAIHHVVFAAATEDSRPVLTGVMLRMEGEQFTLAAADGFRLAVHQTTLLEPTALAESISVIVPAKSLLEVERLLDGQKGKIELIVTPQRSQILFKMKDVEIVSQLIQGTFPNFEELIPKEKDTVVIVGLQELQRRTRTASVFARDGSGIIRLQAVNSESPEQSGKLTVSSRAEEVGDNEGDLEVEIQGSDAKIAFNSRYLSDVLAVIGQEKVILEMTSSSSPGVIRPFEGSSYTHVVMPMFVQW